MRATAAKRDNKSEQDEREWAQQRVDGAPETAEGGSRYVWVGRSGKASSTACRAQSF